jgi:hypothetical protein
MVEVFFMRTIFILTTLFFAVCLTACHNDTHLFTEIESGKSGIHFSNNIVESDSINPIDITNIYNGGGIGAGDFNNDGLQDLYFTGNMVPGKLYLNKGDMTFNDVTDVANVGGNGRWCRGVSVVDINNDGLQDLYISATLKSSKAERTNLLYINQGNDKNSIPLFKEMAAEYGLADSGQSTHAAFFDYDNDSDLDVYFNQ